MTLLARAVQCARMSNTASASSDATPHDEPTAERMETLGVRLPAHLIDALKAKRATMAKATPGAAITISDAVRALILAGLAAES